jgi:hypothetical protein
MRKHFSDQAENWGRPLGGTDFLLERTGGGFRAAHQKAAWRMTLPPSKESLHSDKHRTVQTATVPDSRCQETTARGINES